MPVANKTRKPRKRITEKQKAIARLRIENLKVDKPLSGGEMLVKVGYSKSMSTAKVKDVLNSKGVKDEMCALGFDPDKAKSVVGTILLDEEENATDRLKASDQIFKVFGTYAPEKQAIVLAHVIDDENKKRIDNILEENE